MENKPTYDNDITGWETAKPGKTDSPTYRPFFFAIGITFIFWGMLTNWIIFAAGMLIIIISLAGWVNILRHE